MFLVEEHGHVLATEEKSHRERGAARVGLTREMNRGGEQLRDERSMEEVDR